MFICSSAWETHIGLHVQDAVSQRCAAVIKHAERRLAYRNSVRLIQQPAPPEEVWTSHEDRAHPVTASVSMQMSVDHTTGKKRRR